MDERNSLLENLRNLILRIADVEDVEKTVVKGLESGIDPNEVVDTFNEALQEVGIKYERGEFFLSELIMAGCLAARITSILKPYMIKTERKTLGKAIFGTVKGDIHDIGKNIVTMMLEATGFEIIDLGVDVQKEKFSEVVTREKPYALCMSALLTSTMNEMKNVIDTLEENGLRDSVKIIVGGRPITREFADEIGADGYAKDAVEAVKVIKELVGKGVCDS